MKISDEARNRERKELRHTDSRANDVDRRGFLCSSDFCQASLEERKHVGGLGLEGIPNEPHDEDVLGDVWKEGGTEGDEVGLGGEGGEESDGRGGGLKRGGLDVGCCELSSRRGRGGGLEDRWMRRALVKCARREKREERSRSGWGRIVEGELELNIKTLQISLGLTSNGPVPRYGFP